MLFFYCQQRKNLRFLPGSAPEICCENKSGRGEVTEGVEVEKAGDIREHMENDNRGPSRATHEAYEEIRYLSHQRATHGGGRRLAGGKQEFHHLSASAAGPPPPPREARAKIGDVQGPDKLRPAVAVAGEDPKGSVAELR